MFLEAGVDFPINVTNSYSSSGTFTYSGYYASYNVLLQNLPTYGFPTDTLLHKSGKLILNSSVINISGISGFQFFITNNIQLRIGGEFSRSLASVSKYSSIMGGSSKAIILNYGLRLSLRYYFR
jgi:hypothetical protein